MYCQKCGVENKDGSTYCIKCGGSLTENNPPAQSVEPTFQAAAYTQSPHTTNVNVQFTSSEKNVMGIAGFVCAILAIILSWVPYLGWILWILGAVLSVVGLFKQPKGLAIAGTVISFVGIVFLLVLMVACSSALLMLS